MRRSLGLTFLLASGCLFDSSGTSPRPDLPIEDATLDAPLVGERRDLAPALADWRPAEDQRLAERPRLDGPTHDRVRDKPAPDKLAPDKLAVDKLAVDKPPAPDTKQWPGAPCPCQAPLVCYLSVCRAPCTQDACLQSSKCAASEVCRSTTQVGAICQPGDPAGAACNTSQGLFCAQGLLCTTIKGDSSPKCRQLCTGPSTPQCTCSNVQGMSCSICSNT